MWVVDMAESRQNFDILSLGLIVFGLGSAYGLWRRHEWGRVLAMSFSFVALFNCVGMRFLAPFLAPEIGIHITWETVLVGVLSSACLIGLSLGKIGNDG